MSSQTTVSEGQFQNVHQDLIDGCRRYDQKSQFQIYKLYYKAMYNTSLRILNDTMEAEDIMQESFLSAFEKIGSYSGTVSFGAWMKKIVENRSLDFLKKKRRIIFESIDSLPVVEEACIENHLQNEEQDPRYTKLLAVISLLPEKYRNIISLYFFEGYDHEEIGEILSIPNSTSRSQCTRARNRILREYELR
jgi:RNA polymerase sigma-70 factor (ECF subfamily)